MNDGRTADPSPGGSVSESGGGELLENRAKQPDLEPLPYVRPDPAEAQAASEAFLGIMSTRRSVRQFSSEAVPIELVVNAVATAATAPSDANAEPWTFVIVAAASARRRVREAAGDPGDLAGAPYLIVIFERSPGADAGKRARDLAKASVGTACGFLLASLHMAGLATLVHRPETTATMSRILQRPRGERAFAIVAVGYPAADAVVPKPARRPLADTLFVVT